MPHPLFTPVNLPTGHTLPNRITTATMEESTATSASFPTPLRRMVGRPYARSMTIMDDHDTDPETLTLDGRTFHLSRARDVDVADIVALLTDDPLGRTRESSSLAPYMDAFRRIDADPNHLLLIVRENSPTSGPAVATMQLTLLPGLSRGGATRLQVEAVRIAAGTRGSGLGSALFDRVHAYGRSCGATLAQLTSDVTRTDAHRFYERLGYTASHQGFKLPL